MPVAYQHEVSRPTTTWKSLLHEVISSLPKRFTLRDLEARRHIFERAYPSNRFIDAKIRQSLQVLRNQGVLQFLGSGHYERVEREPQFSPLFDASIAGGYESRAQAARVMLETWAELNLYCMHCTREGLERLAANTPVADFVCRSCDAQYQVKSRNGRFSSRVAGAAYAPMLEAARRRTLPEYVLIEFDLRFSTVVFVDAIPGAQISEDRIIPRRALSQNAKRAGWIGCQVRIDGLPTIRLVEPCGLAASDVRDRWRLLTSSR